MADNDGGTGSRCDVAVVLCRGASRRYGAPKAFAVAADDPRPLLARVVDLYRDRGVVGGAFAGILVVTTADLADGCRERLADRSRVKIVTGPPGGDTALTLALAWSALAVPGPTGAGPDVTHLWAHPVDLPRVAASTLVQLARASAAQPGRVVRPWWDGRPGHPLILPAGLLARLAPVAAQADGPWRELLAAEVAAGRSPPPLPVSVADPGVVLDLDEPERGCADPGHGGPGGGASDTER